MLKNKIQPSNIGDQIGFVNGSVTWAASPLAAGRAILGVVQNGVLQEEGLSEGVIKEREEKIWKGRIVS